MAAAEIEEVQAQIIAGDYEEAIASARAESAKQEDDPEWPLVLGDALNEVGRYEEARDVILKALTRNQLHLRLHLAAYHALHRTGMEKEALEELRELDRLGGRREWAYRAPRDRVALGKVAILVGLDPKRVFDLFFDPVQKTAPELRDSYLASGDLALEKSDYALASRTLGSALKKFPEDPDVWFGLARAFAPSDSEKAAEALTKTLEFNPNHTGARLLVADRAIDGESYDEAEKMITEALAINPRLPEAHALRAVLANLRADTAGEKAAVDKALEPWPKNPHVPHLIGEKLSQKYRFAEGAALQRKALEFDPGFLPAKAQLANDLLRLGGQDEEAWALAEEVQKADPYDVVAYNLVTLRDAVKDFQTLTSEHFTVRMDPREGEIYGPDVLELLERAHDTLTTKYGLKLRGRTIVEIFPDQKDFAIRTFGLPGGAGYLGVCFGRVITANSPATRPESPSNWQAVLWHEFCHVVTLTLTKNKMPRWLSEGISVYEERQARGPANQAGTWGERMKPRYRAMILGDDLTPVSQLSAAFLKPKTPAHIGFAYYESSLAVEWLIERWGLEKMKLLLADLGQGVEINAALAKHFAPMDEIDAEFAKHAQELAKDTGPKLDWTEPGRRDFVTATSTAAFLNEHPDNFAGLLQTAAELMKAGAWEDCKKPLERLIDLYPNQHDADSAYAMLAKVHRELGESDAELRVLTKLAELSSDATNAFERLMRIHAERGEWQKVLDYAARYQAVDPLRPGAYQLAAEAAEALSQRDGAIQSYETLLTLGPADPAEVHFRLARLMHAQGNQEAKRQLLMALEETPRYRAALELLLEMSGPSAPTTSEPPTPEPTPAR